VPKHTIALNLTLQNQKIVSEMDDNVMIMILCISCRSCYKI